MAVKGFPWKYTVDVLSDQNVQDIHRHSLEVLERVGTSCANEGVLKLMAEAGQRVDFENQRIYYDPQFVEQQLALAPHHYTLAGRTPENDLALQGEYGWVSTDGCQAQIIDRVSGDRRYPVKADISEVARIADALPQIGFHWQPVSATDVPVPVRPMHETIAQLPYTTKHIQQMTAIDEINARGIIEFCEVIAGSKEALRERPILSNFQCSISPLHWDEGPLDAMRLFAEVGIPVGICSMPLAAATAPITMAGLLTIANAEILSGIAIMQTMVPGSKTFYVMYATTIDMNSGALNPAWGPEDLTCEMAAGQLGRYYDMPSAAGIFGTGSKSPDWQAGVQNALSGFKAVISPGDMMSGAGALNGCSVFSAAELIMDCDIMDLAMTWAEGYRFDDDDYAVDVIESVITEEKGHFLGEQHTRDHMRDFWKTRVMNRTTWEDWEEAGKPQPHQAAEAEVQRLLAEHEPEPLPEDQLHELERIMDVYQAEAGDDED